MKTTFKLYTTNELKPRGWVKRQLQLQAEGLNGNLDKIWPDVRDSMWIGGDCEGWERVPYWLDGFIPLAYLLDNKDMKKRAKYYIDKILEFQRPDGWICPIGDKPIEKYDTWAILLITKVLTVYYDCSRDKRIPDVIYRIMKNFYELLSAKTIKLFNWGEHRWFEGFIAVNWLRERYPDEEWIKEFGKLLYEQGTDYNKISELWKVPLNKWTLDTHIVNLVMMLKSEALSCDLLGKRYTDQAEKLYRILKSYNGTPTGSFTGDECLSGLSPIQGTELCSIVEQMYSYEQLYIYTQDKKWIDRLEKLAFNALPATISDDMWTHQYVQMSNQIDCTPFEGNPPFRTNGKDSHIFGLEPHFGCCTANFGQGWPKFALSAFMKANDGIVCPLTIPSELSTEWKGVPVKITLDTEYPFRHSFTYRIEVAEDTDLKFKIRIPSFAKNMTVNGKAVTTREWTVQSGFKKGVTELKVNYSVEPHFAARPYRLNTVEYGSLVFAVPVKGEAKMVEYVRNNVERKFPYCDYHIKGVSDWNYAFANGEFSVEEKEVDAIPFSSVNPPLVLKANLCHIDWGYAEGYDTVCAKMPMSRAALDESSVVEMIPYGCAKLRMTELPKVKKS